MLLKYNSGLKPKVGDVIRWKCCDLDDFATWTFTGLVRSDGVLYLGGGIDFGTAIGKVMSYEEVIRQSSSENLEHYESGIDKIGTAFDLTKYIAEFNKRQDNLCCV